MSRGRVFVVINVDHRCTRSSHHAIYRAHQQRNQQLRLQPAHIVRAGHTCWRCWCCLAGAALAPQRPSLPWSSHLPLYSPSTRLQKHTANLRCNCAWAHIESLLQRYVAVAGSKVGTRTDIDTLADSTQWKDNALLRMRH